MFKNDFVATVKCDGKILREIDGAVRIPFGSEYSLYFKNMRSTAAIVNVEIDGTIAVEGLIIQANSSVNLERFVNDLEKGNRFKFIEKTQEISEFRGDKIEDGLIRVEFTFAKNGHIITTPDVFDYYYRDNGRIGTIMPDLSKWHNQPIYNARANNDNLSFKGEAPKVVCMSSSCKNDFPQVDENQEKDGITVPGSISNQHFELCDIGPLESKSHVMVFHLEGFTNNNAKVKKPITVDSKLQCSFCGKLSKSNAKFCWRCGASLEII